MRPPLEWPPRCFQPPAPLRSKLGAVRPGIAAGRVALAAVAAVRQIVLVSQQLRFAEQLAQPRNIIAADAAPEHWLVQWQWRCSLRGFSRTLAPV